MAQSTVLCEICDKRECSQICIDCDQYFCQECKEGHIKTKTTKDHTFHNSATFQPQYKKLRCRKHEQHFIFVCERCQILVCPICLPANHQEHRMLKIDEVASIKKKELNETIETFVTKLNEFEAGVNSLQNITERCKGENKDLLQHVDTQARSILNVLDNQRRCIIESIQQKARTETERISIIVEGLQNNMKEAKEMERKSKLDLKGSDTSLLSNFQLIKSKVKTFEFQDTSISTCPVQFSKYIVPNEELSLLESIFIGNLCGFSEHAERNTLKNMMSKHDVNIAEIQKALANQIHTSATYSNQITALEKKRKILQTEKFDLTTKIETLSFNSYKALKKTQQQNVELEAARSEISKLQKQFRDYVNPIEQKLQEKEQNEQRMLCLLNEKDKMIAGLKEKSDEVATLQKEHSTALHMEKEYIQIRLSIITGYNLTKGNTAITDRPSKISDKYGDLFDNEWIDALEFMDEKKRYHSPDMDTTEVEEIAIRHLCRLLMCCYKECLEKANEQIRTLGKAFKETMCTFDSKEVISLPVFKEASVYRRAKSADFVKVLFERKMLCRNVMDDWNYKYKNEKLMQLLMTSSFFKKCVYICWSMAIQDPVMYLDEDIPADTQIDKNTYKEFADRGNTVAFVVWPALFLHKGGPLLYKGVVQAYSK